MNPVTVLAKLHEAVQSLKPEVVSKARHIEIVAEGDRVMVRFDPPMMVS